MYCKATQLPCPTTGTEQIATGPLAPSLANCLHLHNLVVHTSPQFKLVPDYKVISRVTL